MLIKPIDQLTPRQKYENSYRLLRMCNARVIYRLQANGYALTDCLEFYRAERSLSDREYRFTGWLNVEGWYNFISHPKTNGWIPF